MSKIEASVDNGVLNNTIHEYDEMYDLVDKLPGMFFGGETTVADMEAWIGQMEALLAKAKSRSIRQNDDTTPLE